jgi:signal transduction histidine kinase
MTRDFVIQSKQRCLQRGLDPKVIPSFTERLSEKELEAQCAVYKETMDVIQFFIHKFLSSVSGTPMMIGIHDDEGYTLRLAGDPTIISTVKHLGIVEGVRFSEEDSINSISLALRYKEPIMLLGEDHYHEVLHSIACCSVPFHQDGRDGVFGTLTFMTALEFAHPHLLALLCTIVDSAERELRLRRQNTQLQILNQALLETNHYGVIIADALGGILEINDNAVKMLADHGIASNSVNQAGNRVYDICAIAPYFQKAILNGESCIGVEISCNRQHVMLDVVPIYDERRMLIRAVGSLRDMSERKATEEVLRNTEKLVIAGQLAVGIAHEIRNPLTTVKGMLQYANKGSAIPHFDMVMAELERMNLIVSEFLVLGKPQAIQYKEASSLFILQEVLNIFEMQAEMNGISIQTKVIREEPIRCDANQLKQVFLNVLKNALEALPYGGNIEIVLEQSDSFQRIRVTDNGEGMPEEVLRRIGQPFHTTKQNGTGLGLMIADKIVAAHNGHLTIASHVDQGTTVALSFPLA